MKDRAEYLSSPEPFVPSPCLSYCWPAQLKRFYGHIGGKNRSLTHVINESEGKKKKKESAKPAS